MRTRRAGDDDGIEIMSLIHSFASALKRNLRGRVGPFIAARRPRRVDLDPSLWDLDVGPSGRLERRGVDLTELLGRFGSPLHVVDAAALDELARESLAPLRSGAAAADVFYSYKTNPVPAVLSRLHASGIGAEVISPFELWLAFRLGVPADRIIYNGPAKSPESLRDAIRAGILLINANSAGDVKQIREAAVREQRVASLGLRIALPSMWGGQFGMPSDSPQIAATIAMADGDPMLDLIGLHFHRGFTLRTSDDVRGYVDEVLAFCSDLRHSTGWHPTIIDLGGSLACATVGGVPTIDFRLNRALATDTLPPDPEQCVSIGEAAAIVGERVGRYCREAGLPATRVVIEPGRALTSSSQLLLTTVLDVKTDGRVRHAVLDAGINVAEPASSEYHQLFSVTAPGDAHDTSYRLVGPICTPADVVYNNWRLPTLEPGHVLAIMDTGAYFVPFSTSFSFPRPAIVLHDGDDVAVIRAAETYHDIVRNDVPNR